MVRIVGRESSQFCDSVAYREGCKISQNSLTPGRNVQSPLFCISVKDLSSKQGDEEAKITCAKPTHPGPTQCTSIASGKKTGINSAGEREGKGVWKQNKTRLPLNNAEDS